MRTGLFMVFLVAGIPPAFADAERGPSPTSAKFELVFFTCRVERVVVASVSKSFGATPFVADYTRALVSGCEPSAEAVNRLGRAAGSVAEMSVSFGVGEESDDPKTAHGRLVSPSTFRQWFAMFHEALTSKRRVTVGGWPFHNPADKNLAKVPFSPNGTKGVDFKKAGVDLFFKLATLAVTRGH